MRHDFIDKYSRIDSPVHRLSPGVKCTLFILLIAGVLVVPISWKAFFLLLTLLLIVFLLISRVPPAFVLRRMLYLEPFVLGVSVLTLFQPEGEAVFLRIIVKSSLSLFTVILFSNTTQFGDIVQLMKKMRFPEVIVTTLALFYRYIFVLVDESERMGRARQNRTFSLKKHSLWFLSASVISQLFLKSTERAERIYAAMCARGWK